MNYTKEQLERRLEQLNEYEEQYADLTVGFVGKRELEALEALASEYQIEFDDWFSDRREVEKELIRVEQRTSANR